MYHDNSCMFFYTWNIKHMPLIVIQKSKEHIKQTSYIKPFVPLIRKAINIYGFIFLSVLFFLSCRKGPLPLSVEKKIWVMEPSYSKSPYLRMILTRIIFTVQQWIIVYDGPIIFRIVGKRWLYISLLLRWSLTYLWI